MPAYDDNPDATGDYVQITCDATTGRRSRAAQINAARRRYQSGHGVTLTLIARSYSETHGFMHRSAFKYEIGRPGQVFRIEYQSVRCDGTDTMRETFPTMAAAQAHVRHVARCYWQAWIHAPAGRQSQRGTRTGRNGTGARWYFEPWPVPEHAVAGRHVDR
jgi:hypothetical protein